MGASGKGFSPLIKGSEVPFILTSSYLGHECYVSNTEAILQPCGKAEDGRKHVKDVRKTTTTEKEP